MIRAGSLSVDVNIYTQCSTMILRCKPAMVSRCIWLRAGVHPALKLRKCDISVGSRTVAKDVVNLVSNSGNATIDEEERGGGVGQRDGGKTLSAVGLIMGTAVGPGILGLPAATLPAGLQASTVMILASWTYVMASILLVAELTYSLMHTRGENEVSFTGLVKYTLGYRGAAVVALVYAALNYALLVASITGLGSILNRWIPLPVPFLCVLSSTLLGAGVAYAPFSTVDRVNRGLCALMVVGLTSLVGIGVYAGRDILRQTKGCGFVSSSSTWQAVPVTVLTLGFHVITPVVCKVVGGEPRDARRAILLGGAIPLAMVLTWNAVILGLSPPGSLLSNPIDIILSLSAVAAPAAQAFAFAALGTTLIGYALSFPKQLTDTLELFTEQDTSVILKQNVVRVDGRSTNHGLKGLGLALVPPMVISALFPTAFAAALDFAGIYANCFLFGVLPPVMAWVLRYRLPEGSRGKMDQQRTLLPGGRFVLLLLLGVSILLGSRRPPVGR